MATKAKNKAPTKRKAKKEVRSSIDDQLSLKYKQEMILAWHCNGEVLDGQRISRKQLAQKLQVTEHRLLKLIESVKNLFSKMFGSHQKIQQQFYSIVGTLLYQIKEDRARAVMHIDHLDKHIDMVSKKIEDIWEDSEGSVQEHHLKMKNLRSYMKHLRQLNSQRTEGIKALSQTTQATNHFLNLFSNKGESKFPLGKNDESEGQTKFLSYQGAIRIIQENTPPVLPTQKNYQNINNNPNEGFEELEVLKEGKQIN